MSNDSGFDVFLEKTCSYQRCTQHNKKLALVCMNPTCDFRGVSCTDCLIQSHSGCRQQIFKLQDLENQYIQRLQQTKRRKSELIAKYEDQIIKLNMLRIELNQISSQIINEIRSTIETLSQHSTEEKLAQIYTQTPMGEESKLKLIIEGNLEENQNQKYIAQLQQQDEDIQEFIEALSSCIARHPLPMEGQLADPRVAEQRFAEVNSVAELQNLDSGLEKIRLQITEVADMGQVDLMRFSKAKCIQIGLSRSKLSVDQINQLVLQLKYLNQLQRLHLNLVGSKADETTLISIFRALERLQVQDFGISIEFTSIKEEQLLNQLSRNKKLLKQIAVVRLSNKYDQLSEEKIRSVVKHVQFHSSKRERGSASGDQKARQEKAPKSASDLESNN